MNMPLDADTDTSDDVLLARYARGDAAAARLLVARLTPIVYRHAARVLGDQAEAQDVTQEALIRLWKIAPDWQAGTAKVTTWLFRVTANLCTDRLRKRRGVGLDEIAEPTAPTPSVEAQLQTKSRMDALQTGLMQLPERQRQAVILRHIEGLANPEIAQILDISTEAVESLTARGKRALANIMAPHRETLGYDDDTP
jgi:RNA polymerase sigma-70 factor (ECF subfamily)